MDLAIATGSGPHRVWATFRRGKDTKRVSTSKACAFWTYRLLLPAQTLLPTAHSRLISRLLALQPRFSRACHMLHNSPAVLGPLSVKSRASAPWIRTTRRALSQIARLRPISRPRRLSPRTQADASPPAVPAQPSLRTSTAMVASARCTVTDVELDI